MRTDTTAIADRLRNYLASALYSEPDGSDGIPHMERYVSEGGNAVSCDIRQVWLQLFEPESIPTKIEFTASREHELRGGRAETLSLDLIATLDSAVYRDYCYDVVYVINRKA